MILDIIRICQLKQDFFQRAELGLYYYLISKNKKCKIINVSPLAEHYEFLDPDKVVEIFNIKDHDKCFSKTDLIIALDIGDFKRMKGIVEMIIILSFF